MPLWDTAKDGTLCWLDLQPDPARFSPFSTIPVILFLCSYTHKFCFFTYSARQMCHWDSILKVRSFSWSDMAALFLSRTYIFNIGWERNSMPRPIPSGHNISQRCQRRRTSQGLYEGDITPTYCQSRRSYESMAPMLLLLFLSIGPTVAIQEGWHWKDGCSSLMLFDSGVQQR